jgi:hypothetical protein
MTVALSATTLMIDLRGVAPALAAACRAIRARVPAMVEDRVVAAAGTIS